MICFLDRDGVINVDHGHVGTIDRLEIFSLLPHVVLFLKKLGYRFVVITNQSGLARGYYSYSSFLEVSFKIINSLILKCTLNLIRSIFFESSIILSFI